MMFYSKGAFFKKGKNFSALGVSRYVQSWPRHCAKMMLPCMFRGVAPTLNATAPKKEASFCKKPCLASMDPL